MAEMASRRFVPEAETLEDDVWIRPRRPWHVWERHTASHPVTRSRDSLGHHDKESNDLNSTPTVREFDTFLMELQSRHTDDQEEEVNRKILHDVPTMITSTFRRLENVFPDTFQGAVVHMVGSVGEQTKVGLFEEFDFVVELPALEKELLRLAQPLKFKIEVNAVNLIWGFCLFPDDDAKSETDIAIPFQYTSINRVIVKELLESLLPGWEVTTHVLRSFDEKYFVQQLSLRHYPADGDGNPFEVFCDISFCVPFQWTEDKRHIYRRSGTHEDMSTSDQSYHLLIHGKHCSVTHVFRQNEKLVNNEMCENVKRVYRLAKIITLDLLPRIYDVRRDKFGGPVPSYWLKQIVMYMIDEFPNSSFWKEEHVGLRVTQLMTKLCKCVKETVLSDYFWPDMNHLDDSPKSKCVEWKTARDYVPALVGLLTRAARGDNSALASLKTLCEMSAEFRITVITDAKMTRFNTMLSQYKLILQSGPKEDVPFMANLYNSNNVLTNIKEFARLHLKGVLEVIGEEGDVKIRHESEEISLEDYMDSYINDISMHTLFAFGSFMTECNDAYDKFMAEHCPDLAKQLGKSRP